MAQSDFPTAIELMRDPIVLVALDAAWADSFPDNPDLRHEEGGWIYFQPVSKEIRTRRALPGKQSEISFKSPPVLAGFQIVATFHTLPNPSADGWNPDPSPKDRKLHERLGIPGLIRSDLGIRSCGPDSRRDGANELAARTAWETS